MKKKKKKKLKDRSIKKQIVSANMDHDEVSGARKAYESLGFKIVTRTANVFDSDGEVIVTAEKIID